MLPTELQPMLPALLDALGHLGTGVSVVADRGGGFERWYSNAPAAALLGYTVDEVQALPAIETIAPEQRGLLTQLSASYRAGEPVPPALEVLALHKDGSILPIELVLSPFRIADGVAYVMVVRGVTAQANLSLLEADRIGLVAALAAGFAHEINNPLTSVLLNLLALRKQLAIGLPSAAHPTALRCLEDIKNGADRIKGNVRAFQTLASPGAQAPIDLAAVVSAVLRLARPTLDQRGAHVVRQIFPVKRVLGEESRIYQAVLAMLLFSSSGFELETANTANRIIVSVEQRDGDVVVEVSDNGRDLSPDEIRQAFDTFFRSPARGAGVGIGLGVARSVAATLGGQVTLASRPGGGAVITMRLPAAA
jgi:two-component system, NtrC family, sensor kinase